MTLNLNLLTISAILFFSANKASALVNYDLKSGLFSARVVHVNEGAGLVRFKTETPNIKYINKKDKLEFWDENNHLRKCKGFVIGKTNKYLLVRIPSYSYCKTTVSLATGAYLRFFSQDMVNNVKMGKHLIDTMLKKRLALAGRMNKEKRNLDLYIERAETINKRYEALRLKLENEWREELGLLEKDRVTSLQNYKHLEAKINDLDFKLERYRINDENLELDRWSLDPRLYFRK